MRDLSLYRLSSRRESRNVKTDRLKAIILDVDGSLSNVTDALPSLFSRENGTKDFDAFYEATRYTPPYAEAIDLTKKFYDDGFRLVVVTGRSEKYREHTESWLSRNMEVPQWDGPFMRANDDYRASDILKREVYDRLSGAYDFRYALEDDPKVIEMWEGLGLTVVVGEGRANWDVRRWQDDNLGPDTE